MLTASALHCNWLNQKYVEVKFIYSEKATNVCEISTIDLSYVLTVKFYSGDFEKKILAF